MLSALIINQIQSKKNRENTLLCFDLPPCLVPAIMDASRAFRNAIENYHSIYRRNYGFSKWLPISGTSLIGLPPAAHMVVPGKIDHQLGPRVSLVGPGSPSPMSLNSSEWSSQGRLVDR